MKSKLTGAIKENISFLFFSSGIFLLMIAGIIEYFSHAGFMPIPHNGLTEIVNPELSKKHAYKLMIILSLSGIFMFVAFVFSYLTLSKIRRKLKYSYGILEQRMKAIEASRDGIAITDANGIYTYVNNAYVLTHGLKSSDDIIGKPWKNFLEFENQEVMGQSAFAFLKKNDGWTGFCKALHKDNIELKAQASLSCLDDGGVVFIVRDLSEENIRQDYLETIKFAIEAASDGIAITDKSNRIIFINKSFLKIHGIDPGDRDTIIGNDWRYIYSKKGQEHINSVVLPSTLIRGHWGGYLDVMRKDGNMFYGDASLTRLENGYVLGIMRDVSERRVFEKEKEKLKEQMFYGQKVEAMTRLINGMGGDFKSALDTIKTRAQMAIMNDDIPEELRKYMHDIILASNKAEEMVYQIMSFSKGKNINAVPINLIECILQAGNSLKKKFGNRVKCISDVRMDEAYIFGDVYEFDKIIHGLCENSIDAIDHDSGVLTICVDFFANNPVIVQPDLISNDNVYSGIQHIPKIKWKGRKNFLMNGALSPEKKYIRISIIDNGKGIMPEILPNIFDPFFTTRRDNAQVGLGLSYIQGVVLAAGGAIVVETEVGVGTSVHIYLPQYIKQEGILGNLKINAN